MNILLTGGAGYIGSHAAVLLTQAGHQAILFDNFCNSSPTVLGRLEKILGKTPYCFEGDVRDAAAVEKALRLYKIDAVIHLAGLKSVGESNQKPIEYYSNNVQGTICLLKAMNLVGIKSLVFSSSATVYGDPQYLPIDENHPTNPTNPYGRTKIQIEEMLHDLSRSDSEWNIICLRYFNPVGAHESGLIGEKPNGVPNNLMPYISQVAAGNLDKLNIFGNDYDTFDGTGIRDYIHVMDLAEGHLAALNYLTGRKKFDVVNLGTGRGHSVMQMIDAYQKILGKTIPYQIVSRRQGDIAKCFADVMKARLKLNWSSRFGLEKMCESQIKWENEQRISLNN